MKKTKFLALILCLSFLCTLLLPATAYADDSSAGSGMKYSKTATANKDGSYTITLEAFATGSQTTSTQTEDVPTDIILVLDQSGSMKDPMGGYTYKKYRKSSGWSDRNYHNDEYYLLRHNGGSGNLWHKLNNNEHVAVSVEQGMVYDAISGWSNRKYYDNQNSLYCLVSGEYKSVTVEKEVHLFSADEYWYTVDGQQILYTTGNSSIPNFGQYAPLYQSQIKYTYSYTLNGTTTKINESIGAEASPDTQFYKREYSSSAGENRIDALKSAANAFANAVAAKAAGPDGNINTADDNINTADDNIDHRIAVVGFASGQRYNGTNYNYNNTEVFVGSNQYRYGTAAQGQYRNAFQNMNTSTGVGNVSASIEALSADGGTLTNLGLEMGNGIFGANPIAEGEKRNRVVIVFSDGVPGWSGYDSDTANSAITQAGTAKNTYGATVYTIGIFPGANATSAGNQNGNETQKANWFMQQVSSNNGTPNYPSYYLSAGDAASLNNIFQQISNNITTGGSSTTLGSETVVKDIISPYFTLPAGTTASGIQLDTYDCIRQTGNTYTWSSTSGGPGGATARVNGDQVSVTGFDFSKNWCGTETDAHGQTIVRGKKLVISFTVAPKNGFLGGNDVPTNASAGIYENASAQTPVITFERPTVNVPIDAVTVTAEDKNVYLLGEVTADQLKTGATVKVGDVTLDLSKANDAEQPYGLEPWQTEYVNITVAVKDKDGIPITDKLDNLTDDTTYTVEVTVAPKTVGTSTAEKGDAATAKTDVNDPAANINVFKPEVTFQDSTAYYGETVPANNNYSGNKVSEVWKHDNKEAVPAEMTGNKPDLTIAYTPDGTKLDGTKYGKQDVPVTATVKIGTENVNEHTTFVHQDCTTACGWKAPATPGAPAFLIHIQTCTLNITKQGGAEKEPYVFTVKKDGQPYTEVTIVGNDSVTIYELPVGDYTIEEDTGWSWRYPNPTYTTAIELSAAQTSGTITCTNTLKNNYWLNGFSPVAKNIFGISH